MSLVCSDVVELYEMDKCACMVEWNRVGKGVKISRFCDHML